MQESISKQTTPKVKIVFLGASNVGKTSIVLRYVSGEFRENIDYTLGASFMDKLVKADNGELFQYQIWDTAGQEKFHSLAPIYYKDAHVAVIVYDITDMESYEIAKVWIKEVTEKGKNDLIIALVGNKKDKFQIEKVPFREVSNYAKQIKAIFSLTSAKQDDGVAELFAKITEEIKNKPMIRSTGVRLSAKKARKKALKKKCCKSD